MSSLTEVQITCIGLRAIPTEGHACDEEHPKQKKTPCEKLFGPLLRMVLDSLLPELNAQSATLALVLGFSAISLTLGVRGVRAACPEVPACAIGEAVPCETPPR